MVVDQKHTREPDKFRDFARQTLAERDKLKTELELIRSERYELLAALKGIIDNTTVEFAAANGFGEERNKACEVYDRIMWPANAGGAQ